ncbi:MAG TPA: hypothetical protein VII62_17920 [Vicinamibacteria bacterium]|jgi:hypothetical protein
MAMLLQLLLLSAAPALHEQTFRLERAAEAVAVVRASCPRCDWRIPGREAAVLTLWLDGALHQHLVLTQGASGEYRLLLGPLAAGEHRLALALDRKRSAGEARDARIESVEIEAVAEGDPTYDALAHAPILHTRKHTLARFSDVPLVAWVESHPAPDAGRELRYSIVFSNEDGGTPLDRLLATWGRATDIELVYAVQLEADGRVRGATFQGKDHLTTRFAGRYEGRHPVLYVVTQNNMVRDSGPDTPRVALAPRPFPLDGVSREAVMDEEPWTYRVSNQEVRREGRVAPDARAGSKRIPDPQRFVFLEACGSLTDARVAFDVGLADASGGLRWYASDAGRPDFRIARGGCFRAAAALPAGKGIADVQALRLRAHTRPPRRGEKPLPPGSGQARVDRVNRLFGLGPDDLPGPSVFSWSAGAELRPDGPPLELRVAGHVG